MPKHYARFKAKPEEEMRMPGGKHMMDDPMKKGKAAKKGKKKRRKGAK